MTRRSFWLILLLCAACPVSCTKEQKQNEGSSAVQPTQFERTAECNALAKWPYKDLTLLVCGNGEALTSEKAGAWSGDNIKLYRQRGSERVLIRNFEDTVFGSTYGVLVEATEKGVAVTVSGDRLPEWDVEPVFREEIDLATGASGITPLVPVPDYDAEDVEKLFAAINNREEEVFPGRSPEDAHGKFLELVYGNLFKLRDYGFRNPRAIEAKLMELRKRDWNDGEVAEVFAQLLSQVSYLKGKQVAVKK